MSDCDPQVDAYRPGLGRLVKDHLSQYRDSAGREGHMFWRRPLWPLPIGPSSRTPREGRFSSQPNMSATRSAIRTLRYRIRPFAGQMMRMPWPAR
jgi:hypothetical protein